MEQLVTVRSNPWRFLQFLLKKKPKQLQTAGAAGVYLATMEHGVLQRTLAGAADAATRLFSSLVATFLTRGN